MIALCRVFAYTLATVDVDLGKEIYLMMARRTSILTVAVAILGNPLAALAVPTGSVTTAPIASAPAIALPLLLLLAVVLTGITVYRLRATSVPKILAVLGIAAALASIGITYAVPTATITISDGNCYRTVTNPYDPTDFTVVTNHCINPIKIVNVSFSCNEVNASGVVTGEIPVLCTEGLVLAPNAFCHLPQCL